MAKDNDPTSDSGGLDALLSAMPRIAEAVKAFPEGVQAQAFEALMAELTGKQTAKPAAASKSPRPRKRRTANPAVKNTTKPQRRRSGGPTAVKDLDLSPKNKESLKTFVEQKNPKTNHDRNVVAVYYLVKVLGFENVSVNHVFTCYKDMRWREPGDLANSLALTASRKRYLDTANLDDIRLTPAGRNHVEHDLPHKKKAK